LSTRDDPLALGFFQQKYDSLILDKRGWKLQVACGLSLLDIAARLYTENCLGLKYFANKEAASRGKAGST
jgi:hypothetical protein